MTLGSPIPRAAFAAASIVANGFDGGPKTTVAMAIGDRAPIAMTRVAMPDPFVEEVFSRNDATRKPWVKAELSSHMWTARLLADLPAGTWHMMIDAVTEYGDTVSSRIALEVTG